MPATPIHIYQARSSDLPAQAMDTHDPPATLADPKGPSKLASCHSKKREIPQSCDTHTMSQISDVNKY
jgi:hypothetical protein